MKNNKIIKINDIKYDSLARSFYDYYVLVELIGCMDARV